MITFVCLLYMLGIHTHYQYIRYENNKRIHSDEIGIFINKSCFCCRNGDFKVLGERKMVNRKELQRI